MITALRVRGPFRGPSGYDHYVREFVRELVRQGVAIQLVDLPDWGPARLPESARDLWFDRLSRPVDSVITLHFSMPHQVISDGRGLDVNYTMFEATHIPDAWVEHNRRQALVIVPTESSRRAWLATGFPPDRLRICPLGIDADRFGQEVEALALRTEAGLPVAQYGTRFLNVSELGPRKNLTGLLRAWLIATTADDDASCFSISGAMHSAGSSCLPTRSSNCNASSGGRFGRPLRSRSSSTCWRTPKCRDSMRPRRTTSACPMARDGISRWSKRPPPGFD